MTIPSAFSMQDVNNELGRTPTLAFDMNDVTVRDLAKVSLTANSAWSMASLQGKQAGNVTVGVGFAGSLNNYGFNDGSDGGGTYGSCSPGSLLGQDVQGLKNGGSNTSLIVSLLGVLAQTFWTTLLIRTSFNSAPIARLLSSAATQFVTVGGVRSEWRYLGSSPINISAYNGQNLIFTLIK